MVIRLANCHAIIIFVNFIIVIVIIMIVILISLTIRIHKSRKADEARIDLVKLERVFDSGHVKVRQRNVGSRLRAEVAVLLNRMKDDGVDGGNRDRLEKFRRRLLLVLLDGGG